MTNSDSAPATFARGTTGSLWPTLLLVDGDVNSAHSVVRVLEKRGVHVVVAASIAEAQDYVHRRKNWSLIITEYHLPDGRGPELTDWIREAGCSTPVMLMSGSPHAATHCAGFNFLLKPLATEKIESAMGVGRR